MAEVYTDRGSTTRSSNMSWLWLAILAIIIIAVIIAIAM